MTETRRPSSAWVFACVTLFFAAPAVAASLSIAEAGATNAVTKANVKDVETKLILTVVNSQKKPIAFTPLVTDFRDASLTPYDTTVSIQGAPAETSSVVSALGKTILVVTAKGLKEAGDYQGMLYLSYDDKIQNTIALKIARITLGATKPVLEISDIPAAVVDMPVTGSGTAKLTQLTVADTAGAGTTMNPPQLRTLIFKPTAQVEIAAPPAHLALKAKDVKPQKEPQPVDLIIDGLTRPERYQAKIRFTAGEATPVDKDVTIYARQPWQLAAIFILVGMAIASGLKWYATVLRPRLALELRVAALVGELNELARGAADDADAIIVIGALHDSLRSRWRELARTHRLIGSTDWTLYETKLPILRSWIALRHELRDPLPPGARKLLETGLRDAAKAIGNPAATATDLATAASKLGTLHEDVSAAAAEEIRTLIADLQNTAGASALQDGLVAASEEIERGNTAAALKDLDKVIHKYIKITVPNLRNLLQVVPDGMEMPDGLQTRVSINLKAAEAAQSGAVALNRYRQALKTFIAEAGEALFAHIAGKSQADAARKQQYDALNVRLRQLITDASADKLRDAEGRWKRVVNDFSAITSGGAELAAHTKSPVEPVLGKLLDFTPAALSLDVDFNDPRAVYRLHWMMTALRIAVGIVIVSLGLLLGLRALWFEDWTWGGWQAYAIALLWGAGLSSFTSDGITALITRVLPSSVTGAS